MNLEVVIITFLEFLMLFHGCGVFFSPMSVTSKEGMCSQTLCNLEVSNGAACPPALPISPHPSCLQRPRGVGCLNSLGGTCREWHRRQLREGVGNTLVGGAGLLQSVSSHFHL